MSSKVHGAQRVLVDLHRLRQRLMVSSVTLPRGMASFSTVVLLVHQVVPGPEGHQVSVVCRRRDGHGACAAHVGVTQLVGEDLQLVGREAIVIPEHMVVRGPACSLKAGQRVRGRHGPEGPGLTCPGVLRSRASARSASVTEDAR